MYEVIIVNDGCTEKESFEGLEWWKVQGMLPVKELRLEDNVGFLLASNTGMKSAAGDIICLISNDVRIKGDIVKHIDYIIHGQAKSLIGGRFLDFDTGWNTFGNVTFPYCEGWLLAATKLGWEDLGYFDERYVPNDFEDVDISVTASSKKGYYLLSLPEKDTQHTGAQSIKYSPEREALTKRNREKFRKKWKLP